MDDTAGQTAPDRVTDPGSASEASPDAAGTTPTAKPNLSGNIARAESTPKATKAAKAAGTRATKAAGTRTTKATGARPKATGATKAAGTRTTKAAGTRAARTAKVTAAAPARRSRAGSDPAGAGGERTGNLERAPWGRGRGRALYSRRIQRSNERWPLAAQGLAGLLSRPELVLAALGRREAVERDGRVLNRGAQALIELTARLEGTGDGSEGWGRSDDPVVMRRQLRRSAQLAMPIRTDVHAWGRVVPATAGAPPVPVRLYRQYGVGLGLGGRGRQLPAVVYFHGGGWVTGDLDSHDASCRMLAAVARCLVVSVHYRLAPEDPFPAAVDDALAAYTWVQQHTDELGIDPGQVGVMGDSAGGNLAAVVALEARAGSGAVPTGVGPPAAQGLIYPAVDARLDTESIRTLGEGFFLTTASMVQFRQRYLPDPADWTAGRASPLLAEDHAGAAPALVVTAGFDPLRDDGANYAEVLRAAGVDVEYRCYDDQIHGFMGMGILSDSLALATEVCDAMGRLIRRSSAGELPT